MSLSPPIPEKRERAAGASRSARGAAAAQCSGHGARRGQLRSDRRARSSLVIGPRPRPGTVSEMLSRPEPLLRELEHALPERPFAVRLWDGSTLPATNG